MDYDESSDILGGRLQVSPQPSAIWSDPAQITLLLGLGLAAVYTWTQLAPHYRQWRETRYKKATRRRHGIPDDDNRPFNVAYAAALHARKQREGKSRPYLRDGLLGGAQEDVGTSAAQHFSRPAGYSNAYPSSDINGEAIQYSLAPRQEIPTIHSTYHQDHISRAYSHPPLNSSAAHITSASKVKQPLATQTSHGKHALDDEADSEPEMLAKKSRVEGKDSFEGDGQVQWNGSDEDMEVDEVLPLKRGSKRVASSEDDEGLELSRTARRDKRPRKVSLEKSPESPDEDMDQDEDFAQDAEALTDVVRGKKRDRAEAGSTFGGDDYLVDGDNGEQPKRRRHKGRASQRVEALRGQKRGRGSHSSQDSDQSDSDQPRPKATRKKRGRKSREGIGAFSNDPLCKGRRIGEEWECNGIMFKVGANGQRLRQELVKKSRSRFAMPSDSQHPDRRAHVDVYVEVWLSEEDYQRAKERQDLAWQDSVSNPLELHTVRDVAESPCKLAGKNLLYSSISSRETSMSRGPLRQSITTNAAPRFPSAPAVSIHRISSIYHTPASPAVESPQLQKTKSFSKWEKQDLEAAAMSKIRDRQQVALARDAPKALPTATLSSNVFTRAPNSDGTPASNDNPACSQVPGNPPITVATALDSTPSSGIASKLSKSDLPKINTTPAALTNHAEPSKSTFSFAPPAPANSGATRSAAPPTNSSVPNFFAKPNAPTTSQPATSAPSTTASSVPNFFAKPTAQISTPTDAATTTPSGASKPSFSFGLTSGQQTGNTTPFSNATNDPAKDSEQSKAAASGPSLLTRLGMGPPPSSQPVPVPIAKPDSTSSAASSAGNAASIPSSTSAVQSGPPKFNFGLSSKPTTKPASNPPSVPGGALPTTGALSAPASSTPKFSFGVTNSHTQPAKSSTQTPAGPFGSGASGTSTSSSTTKPQFSFGVTSTPGSEPGVSPFGAASGIATTGSSFGAANTTAKPVEVTQSAFAFGNASSATTSGAASNMTDKPAEPIKSAFSLGGNANASSFSSAKFVESSKSVFGLGNAVGSPASSSTDKPTEPVKSAFSLGGNTNASPFSVPGSSSSFGGLAGSSPFGVANNAVKSSEAPKPAFFGNTTVSPFAPAQKADSQATKAVFGFGATPAFGSTSIPTTQSTRLTFGFGASTNATTASSTMPGSTTSGSEHKSPFSFNIGQPSTANPSSTPAASGTASGEQHVNDPTTTPAGSPFSTATSAGQQGASAFGFGAPSGGAFSFGANSGQDQQK